MKKKNLRRGNLMFLKRIKLKNFGNVSQEELFFHDGITVFSGDNGEGKSTILRAISMGLFNRFPLTFKDYIKWGEEYFQIELDFDHSGKSYELSIKYDGSTSRNLLCTTTNEEWQNSPVLDKLDEIFDVKRAIASTISFEHEIDLITTQPSERREYLKGIYDLNFRKQLDIIEKDISNTQKEIDSLKGEIISLESQTFTLFQLERPPFTTEKCEEYKKQRLELEKRITLYEERISSLEDLKKDIESKKSQFQKKKSREEEEVKGIKTLQAEVGLKEKEESEAPNEFNPSIIVENFSEKNKKLENELEKLKTQEKELLEKKQSSEALYKESSEGVESALLEKQRDETILEQSLINSKRFLEKFKKGICPTCDQPISDSKISIWANKVIEEETSLNKIKEELEGLKKRKDQSQRVLSELNKIEQQVYEVGSTIKIVTSNMASLEQEKEREISYEKEKFFSMKESLKREKENLKSRLQDKFSSVQILQDELKELYDEIQVLEDRLAKVEPVPLDEFNRLKSSLQNISESIQEYERVIISNNEKREFNKRIEREKEERDISVLKKKKDLDKLENDSSKFQLAKKIFSREFPSFVLSQLVKSLEVIVNEFLSRVYPHYEISIEESKNALKISYGENKSDVKMSSGFEKQIFSFAYKYALGKLQNYEILFLDEVDSAASVSNSKKFYETIGKMESCFRQLFIITHKEEIKELLSNDYQASVYQVSQGSYELI